MWFHIQGSAIFTAAHFVPKCHTRGVTRANHWEGVEKSQQCRKFFSSMQYIYSQNTIGSNMEATNLFLAPGPNLTWVRPFVTPWALRKNPASLVFAPVLMFSRSLPRFMAIGKDRNKGPLKADNSVVFETTTRFSKHCFPKTASTSFRDLLTNLIQWLAWTPSKQSSHLHLRGPVYMDFCFDRNKKGKTRETSWNWRWNAGVIGNDRASFQSYLFPKTGTHSIFALIFCIVVSGRRSKWAAKFFYFLSARQTENVCESLV